ncbi:hypothetical protein FRC08_002163 [Ceratobasidium sp. 394]|nr:hypothetical protein FRC08_002163 [Ceratobasidium sp. 394]
MVLQHQNIVKVFGLGESLDLRVEYCANGTVRQYLKDHQDPHSKKQMIRDVIRGMVYLHSQSPAVVHGSLRTEKIFIAEGGRAKIGEFGLSSLTWSFALLAPSISHAGSSRWMSPELIKFNPDLGTPVPTTASDMWALGCVFMEILFGQIPYGKYKHELIAICKTVRSRRLWTLPEKKKSPRMVNRLYLPRY